MVDIGTLFRAVLLLFCMMIPGYILKKTRLGDDRLPLGFTNTILYVTQPAMLIVGFFRPFDAEMLKTAAVVLVLSFVAHIMFFGVSLLCFRRASRLGGNASRRSMRLFQITHFLEFGHFVANRSR